MALTTFNEWWDWGAIAPSWPIIERPDLSDPTTWPTCRNTSDYTSDLTANIF